MKRMRSIALCMVAALAMSLAAVSVASAATQPVYYGIAEVGKTVTAKKLSGTLGIAFLEGKTSKAKIECKKGTATGEINSATTTVNNVTTFTECAVSGLPCKSAGQPEGTIQTAALEGETGAASATLPGVRLFAPGQSGKEPKTGALAEFECGGVVSVVVTGSVIGSLSGAQGKTAEEGKFATSTKLTFAQAAGKQKYEKFLEGSCKVGNCGPEQLTSTINGTPELGGQSVIATLKTVPFAGQLGVTK